nr:MAG TPA: replisome organizer protein [Caudoviricetes sp.]
MARNYWLRLKKDFFSQPKMRKLRRIAGGDTYTIIYLKMELLSINDEGHLYFEGIEENFVEEIALKIDEDPENVQVTISYLLHQGLLEQEDENTFLLPEVLGCIGSEVDSAERVRRYRERKALQCNGEVLLGNVSVTASNTEIDRDKEKNNKSNIKSNKDTSKSTVTDEPKEKIPYQAILDAYTSTCKSLQRCTILSDKRKSAIKARFASGYTLEDFETVFKKAENSKFLKGGNDRDWRASFDWLIKDANMAKVLDGNYDDWKGDGTSDGRESGQKIVEGGGGHDFRPVSGIIQV